MFFRFTNILALCLLVLLSFPSMATEPMARNLYSGGMLILQPGKMSATNPYQNISDRSSGLGGILRLYFGRYATAGIYGSTHRTTYSTPGSENSTLNLGYGGPFAGFSMRRSRFRFTLSAFAGRGTIRNLHINQQDGQKLIDATLHQESVWVLSPIISVDYALTHRLVFTLQMARPTTSFNNHPLYAPTFQAGLLFNR